MLRSLISQIMVVALLILSVEGASDIEPVNADLHPDEYAQHIGDGDPNSSPASKNSDEADMDHCENCCHGHTSCPVAPATAVAHIAVSAPALPGQQKFQYLALAPPTPPPTA